MAKRWNLNNRTVRVRRYTSGQCCDYTLRILWSTKLGMCLKGTYTLEQANALAARIRAHGSIDPTKWDNTYYPGNHFLHDSACD